MSPPFDLTTFSLDVSWSVYLFTIFFIVFVSVAACRRTLVSESGELPCSCDAQASNCGG